MGATRWHFALHFLPQLLPHHQQAKTEGETVMHRERDGQNGAVRKGRTWNGEWVMKAGPTLPSNCRCRVLSVLPLPQSLPSFSLPRSHAPPASSSKIRRGGLAASNEIPSARFQTFTYSRTFSNAGAKRWTTRGKDGGLGGEIKTDEAWNGKSEARKRRGGRPFPTSGGELHVRSSQAYFRLQLNVQRHFCPHEGWKKKTHYTQKQQYLDFKFPAMHQPRPGFDAINWNKAGS